MPTQLAPPSLPKPSGFAAPVKVAAAAAIPPPDDTSNEMKDEEFESVDGDGSKDEPTRKNDDGAAAAVAAEEPAPMADDGEAAFVAEDQAGEGASAAAAAAPAAGKTKKKRKRPKEKKKAEKTYAYPVPDAADKKDICQMALNGQFEAVEKKWGPALKQKALKYMLKYIKNNDIRAMVAAENLVNGLEQQDAAPQKSKKKPMKPKLKKKAPHVGLAAGMKKAARGAAVARLRSDDSDDDDELMPLCAPKVDPSGKFCEWPDYGDVRRETRSFEATQPVLNTDDRTIFMPRAYAAFVKQHKGSCPALPERVEAECALPCIITKMEAADENGCAQISLSTTIGAEPHGSSVDFDIMFESEEHQSVPAWLLQKAFFEQSVTKRGLTIGAPIKMQFADPSNPSIAVYHQGRIYNVRRGLRDDPFEAIDVVWYDVEDEKGTRLSPSYCQLDNSLSPWEIEADSSIQVATVDLDSYIARQFSPASTAVDVVRFLRNGKMCEAALVFNEPLPPKHSDDGKRYYAQIEKPITLREIEENLRTNEYVGAGMERMWADLALLSANAKTFNQREVLPWRAADMLEATIAMLRRRIDVQEVLMEEDDHADSATPTADEDGEQDDVDEDEQGTEEEQEEEEQGTEEEQDEKVLPPQPQQQKKEEEEEEEEEEEDAMQEAGDDEMQHPDQMPQRTADDEATQKEEEPACAAEHDQTASELSGESVYTINKSIEY